MARIMDTREAVEELAASLDSMLDGFFLLDREWHVTYANARIAKWLGLERIDLLGRSVWDVVPQVRREQFFERFSDALERQAPMGFETYYEPLGRWAFFHLLPTPKGLTVYVFDITDRKRTEVALARSEAQMSAFFENSPDAVFMKDLDGRFLRVNAEFARVLGVEPDEAIGKHDADFMDPAVARRLMANDAEVIASKEPDQFEEEVRTASGEVRVYLTTKFPIRDRDGNVYAIGGIAADITHRSRQERELAASEERFRKVFSEGPLGIALLDPTLALRQFNNRFAQMLGYSKGALLGKTLPEIVALEDLEHSIALARQLLRGDIQSYKVERRFRRSDGSTFWGSVHGTLLRDDLGNPRYVMSLVEDITQRRSAEEVLRNKDQQIRQAYSEVLAALTGGKIVLMTPDEIGEAIGPPLRDAWQVEQYSDLGSVRHELAATLAGAGMAEDAVDSYVLAACEAFTNALKHAGGGEVRVHKCGDDLQVVVRDHGPGIDFEHLPRATLLAGFSTAQSLGAGFTIMLDICDRLLLSTQEGLTMVVLESSLSADRTGSAGPACQPEASLSCPQ